MLWKATALMRFAHFPTIYSVLSNAVDLRRQSRHVFLVPMENPHPMTWRVVSRTLTKCAISLRVVRLARQRPEGRQSQISKTVLQLKYNFSASRASELNRTGTN
jgi:hypothetical protein